MFAHAMYRDIGAHRCQPFGEGAAEPAARAGYQRDLALQRRVASCCAMVCSPV